MGAYSMTSRRRAIRSQAPAWLQSLIAVVGGAVLFVLIVMVILFGYAVYHGGQIYPGVSMAGIDLSNLTPAQAAERLSGRLAYPWNGRIVFQGAGQTWTASPEALGLSLDPQSNAQAAYLLGREGDPFSRIFKQSAAWFGGVDLAPALVYDERQAQQFLAQIAAQVDRPTLDANLKSRGCSGDCCARAGWAQAGYPGQHRADPGPVTDADGWGSATGHPGDTARYHGRQPASRDCPENIEPAAGIELAGDERR